VAHDRPAESAERWKRLWRSVRPERGHPAPGALGEFAQLLGEGDATVAARAFPDVAAHLEEGCPRCRADVQATLRECADEPPGLGAG
jgi:hypothetical protein